MSINFIFHHAEETKVDLPANVKSKSRSSSNNSTSSHSSTTQVKPALSKLSQLNRMTSSVAEPSAISMYQPSISMLAKPVINTTKLLNQKHEKAIEDDLEEACKTNQVNICLRLYNKAVKLRLIPKRCRKS